MVRLGLDKPIVNTEWVYLSCQAGQLAPLDEFFLPPFKDMRIALSGFLSQHRRAALSEIIEKNGGTFCADLSQECTHLIVQVRRK